MEGKRRRVVDMADPRLAHLDEVLRQLRVHLAAYECGDPMLQPMLERVAAKCTDVEFSPNLAGFRFDPIRGRHHRGSQYEYVWGDEWGYLRKIVRETGYGVLEVGSPFPQVPTQRLASAADLLDAIMLLEVQAVMEG